MSAFANHSPVAIVGVGGVFPGASTLGAFWDGIREGVDQARECPPGRWALHPDRAYSERVGLIDHVYSKRACFLDPVPLDDAFFAGLDIDRNYCRTLDPMVHVALRAARDAVRDAGLPQFERKRVGLILGNIALPTESSSALADWMIGREAEAALFRSSGREQPEEARSPTAPINRHVMGHASGVVSTALGLGGGHYAIDAACASSLYSLALAVEELQAHRADAMLAGGLSRPDSLFTQMGFSQLGALSKRGVCASFDAAGDGLVVGEGAGVVVLKRLEDALAHGDSIYGVIRGIGLSNDVDGDLLAPSQEGQLRALREAYRSAGWAPTDVELIECHATGTPIGDATEVGSLRTLWEEAGWTAGDNRRCVLGSVKTNVGHLLTGAGAAGLIKVLLAFKNETLPPVANFRTANPRLDLENGPFRVLSEAEPWTSPRRAAVSAFGFGGTNAHVLLERWDANSTGSSSSAPELQTDRESVTIVGLGGRLGPWEGMGALEERMFSNDHTGEHLAPHPRSPDGPAGYFIDALKVPFGDFRIPPKELQEILPQQTLMLQAAAEAVRDAGLHEDTESALRTGVFVGIGLDLGTTNAHLRWTIRERGPQWADALELNLSGVELDEWLAKLCDAVAPPLNPNRTMGGLGGIVASRIARELGFGGPTFALASEETSGYSALEAAVRALQSGHIDVAVVGAVDMQSDRRHATLPHLAERCLTDGALAVVLRRSTEVTPEGAYAKICGLGAATAPIEDDGGESDTYVTSVQRACRDAGLTPADITFLETTSQTLKARSVEHHALEQLFAQDGPILGNVQAHVGDAGAASSLVGVVRGALALGNRCLPASGGPSPWIRGDSPRRVGISSSSLSGNYAHVLLEEVAAAEPRRPAPEIDSHLFVFEGDSSEELLALVERLRRIVEDSPPIARVERGWANEQPRRSDARLGAALAASNLDELKRAAELLHRAISADEPLNHIGRWSAHYEPAPLGKDAKVAFVYPGSGSHFPNMGLPHALRFPEVLRTQETRSKRLGEQLRPDLIWNGDALEHATERDLILAQVSLGTLLSDVLRGFSIVPQAALGYSLGETTALFSMGAWTDRDGMLERTLNSPLFTSELAGTFEAARRYWKLSPEDPAVEWTVGVINRPTAAVRQAIASQSRAYLLITNTPEECVVGGDARAVQALVDELDCQWVPLPGVTSVHCEVAKEAAEAYRKHHLLPTTVPEGVDFYSGARAEPYKLTQEAAADSIVAQALDGIDFPQLMTRAWEDGYRVFLEIGPGRSCTRMIESILQNRRYVATSVCAPGEGIGSLASTLGRLVAERIPVDLTPWFDSLSAPAAAAGERRCLTIPVGLEPLDITTSTVPRSRDRDRDRSRSRGRDRSTTDVVAPAYEHHHERAHPTLPPPHQSPEMGVVHIQASTAGAHDAFLRLAQTTAQVMTSQAAFHLSVAQQAPHTPVPLAALTVPAPTVPTSPSIEQPAYDRAACMELAIGKLAKAWGPEFAEVDTLPTRVRLPDEPLMLVDRIMTVEGEPRSLGSGRIVTEHDVLPEGWYLDGNRIPTSIAVEAGQADLILSGYLGIDFETRGESVYRLLDATVTFHDHLPAPGKVIRYDIRINRFLEQGDTWLFWFQFDATVDGKPLLTMRNGCAGFFSPEELAAGAGIVQSAMDQRKVEGLAPEGNGWFAPAGSLTLDAQKLEALRGGDLSVLSPQHQGLPVDRPLTLPSGKMCLIDRVTELEPAGGRFGLGRVKAEADIHPDDWFLTCHFVDDQVMPGTLMYESTMQTLRVLLMRAGWVAEARDGVVFEPKPEIASRLRCRGQVLSDTKVVAYEVSIKEVGFHPEPYVIADALMYADGKPIVEIGDMSVQLTGVTKSELEATWNGRTATPVTGPGPKPAVYDTDRILAFAVGNPSDAFGSPYLPFDNERHIARLPGPPFMFLDRITHVEGAPFELQQGAACEAQYWVDPESWYFEANRQEHMPYAVLLETALQPCGWLAAYAGSALTSDTDLKFRNLGGDATQHQEVLAGDLLTTRVRMTGVSTSLGMIIQHYSMEMHSDRAGLVYEGKTYFGFFSEAALADQVGLTEATLSSIPSAPSSDLPRMPLDAPFPEPKMRMVDCIDVYDPAGGDAGLGFVRGSIDVNPDAWFFAAHFYQDPVWPGSLGLEAFLQLLKVAAVERLELPPSTQFHTMPPGHTHRWTYRGQVIPKDAKVMVEVTLNRVDSDAVYGSGYLTVDGRIIYQIDDFGVGIRS